MYTFKINSKKFESIESKLNGRDLLTIAELLPVEDYELLYKINEKGFEPIQLDEEVDLKKAGIEGFRAKPFRKLTIKVDEEEYELNDCFATPTEIMTLVGINPDQYYLKEIRNGNVEVTFKDDSEHRIAITKSSTFISCKREDIQCVIVNAREKTWSKETVSFDDVVILAFGQISNNPDVIYTILYKKGVPSKPEGSMVRGDVIYVKNKMIFNVTQTNKS